MSLASRCIAKTQNCRELSNKIWEERHSGKKNRSCSHQLILHANVIVCMYLQFYAYI